MKGARLYTASLDRLSRYLNDHDMRPSKVRNMVLEQACALPQPFTAKKLEEVCVQERISVGTVYNSLKVFVAAQIVRGIKRQRGTAAAEYEFVTGSTNRMQIICKKCGRVTEVTDKAITRLIQERKYSNFNMQHFSLSVYGECKVCRRYIRRMKQ